MKKNDLIKCSVVGYQDYGMFVKCDDDFTGLVHISEISEQFVQDIEDIFNIDDIVRLTVLDVDHENKKLKLSYKANHKTNKRILKNVKITKGFNRLANNLDEWIKIKLEEYGFEKDN